MGGTLALIHGDAGARLGWDTTAIQHAALDGQIAQTRLDEATRRIGQLDLDDRALRDAPIEPRIPRGPLDDSAAIQVMVARDAAREIREGERDRIADELKLLNGDRLEAIGLVNAAASRLDELKQAGHTRPLDDREPTQLELDASAGVTGERRVALDEETWDQALERAQIAIGFLIDEPIITPEALRSVLNLCEWAAVMGTTTRAVRDRISGRPTPMFPLTGPDSPVVGEGKRRGIDTSKLSEGFKRRLLTEQLEMIDQFRAFPMGSTNHGGRRQ